MMNSTRTFNCIESHITIEKAKELGLIQIVKQLEIDASVRKCLGMQSLQLDITSPIATGRGRPKTK